MQKTILALGAFLATALTLSSRATAQQPTGSVEVVTTYAFPKSSVVSTSAYGIANNGASVGQIQVHRFGSVQGYQRSANGRLRTIVFPGAVNTFPTGINNSGLTCGYISIGSGTQGFFYDGRTYTAYLVPGSSFTEIFGINDQGDFVGVANLPGLPDVFGFVSRGGAVTTIAIPGGSTVLPQGINNLGQIVGNYLDGAFVTRGFFRDTEGTLTYPIDFPGGSATNLTGMNDDGLIVGYATVNFQPEAIVLRLPDQFTPYQYPGSIYGLFRGVNNSGLISGTYENFAEGGIRAILAQFIP